jgi:hypothetical protein
MGDCHIVIYFLIQQHSIRAVVFRTGESYLVVRLKKLSSCNLHDQAALSSQWNDFNQPFFFTVMVLTNML